jgi:hypothetical protein
METKPDSSREWRFDDSPRVAVFTTTHVVRARKPILYIAHDNEDGAWQFHSGDDVSTDDAMIVALEEIVKIDPSVEDVADLPLGCYATRTDPGAPWKIGSK